MKCARILLFSTLALAAPAWGRSPPLLLDFSRVQHKPGRSTIDLDYTRLPRYATQNSEKPDHLDARQITLIVFLLDQPAGGTPMTLFFDNVRLAREATGELEAGRE